jgi:hypothetical protein
MVDVVLFVSELLHRLVCVSVVISSCLCQCCYIVLFVSVLLYRLVYVSVVISSCLCQCCDE